jgi:hypothetical protein
MSHHLRITLLAVATAAVLAGCGGGDDSPKTASKPSATPTPTKTPAKKPPKGKKQKTPKKADYADCLRKGGATLSDKVKDVSSSARKPATKPFTVRLPDKEFGGAVDDVVFLPFDQFAVLSKTFTKLKPKLGKTRRVMKRDNLLVVFGVQANRKVLDLIVKCTAPT